MTASSDWTDSYGVMDFAIGFFTHCEDSEAACRRIVRQWWQRRADRGGSAWEYLFSEGLIDEEMAEQTRDEVWRSVANTI